METRTNAGCSSTASPTLSLRKASVQEIQLELIRRRKFDGFDGECIVAALLEHRDLWEAVIMERLALSNPGKLPSVGLVKLRDLPTDDWNVNVLYILTSSMHDAEKLVQSFGVKECGGMVHVHSDRDEVDCALGGAEEGQTIVSIWWD
jgi:hypothetical protein